MRSIVSPGINQDAHRRRIPAARQIKQLIIAGQLPEVIRWQTAKRPQYRQLLPLPAKIRRNRRKPAATDK